MWVSPHHSAVVPLSVEVTCNLTAPSINVRVVARGAQLKGRVGTRNLVVPQEWMEKLYDTACYAISPLRLS
jgi:hypothetical protein